MKVKAAAAQYPIAFHHSLDDWKKHIKNWVEHAIKQGASLLIFPEYGSMELVSLIDKQLWNDIKGQVEAIEQLSKDFCDCFISLAHQFQIIIVAPSIPVQMGDKIYNRAYVFSPKGLVGYQDKFFMTRFENEDWGIDSPPKQLSIFETNWGSFGIQICYDIEFALGSQLLCEAGAKLIVAPSCTETIRGATRVHIGARARALENQCYTIVSQTIGNSTWSPTVDINYGFGAAYCTPDLDFPEEGILQTQTHQTEGWLVQEFDFNKIEHVRRNGQVFNYKDLQNIKSSYKSEEISIKKIIV